MSSDHNSAPLGTDASQNALAPAVCRLFSTLFYRLLLLIIFLGCGLDANAANPFVHQLFTSHMVLQRDASDPIWGWVTAGNTVTVIVVDQTSTTIQTVSAVADSNGRWQVSVGPFGLVPNNAAYTVTISSAGQTTVTLTDVLIGDVLLCTGQSNMDFSLNTISVYNLAAEITGITRSGSSDVVITFSTVGGKTYAVEKTTNLGSAPWSIVQDNVAGTDGAVSVTDAGGRTQPRQFYRARVK